MLHKLERQGSEGRRHGLYLTYLALGLLYNCSKSDMIRSTGYSVSRFWFDSFEVCFRDMYDGKQKSRKNLGQKFFIVLLTIILTIKTRRISKTTLFVYVELPFDG
jgi:hypothetical protein